jgi:hypothetical protein
MYAEPSLSLSLRERRSGSLTAPPRGDGGRRSRSQGTRVYSRLKSISSSLWINVRYRLQTDTCILRSMPCWHHQYERSGYRTSNALIVSLGASLSEFSQCDQNSTTATTVAVHILRGLWAPCEAHFPKSKKRSHANDLIDHRGRYMDLSAHGTSVNQNTCLSRP